MDLPYLTFIESIDINLELFRKEYYKLINTQENERKEVFHKVLIRWFHHDSLESPLLHLMDSIIDYEEQGAFISEIKKCLLANHLGVIEYTKVLLEQQYQFMQKMFPDTINYYFNNVDESYDLLELMFTVDDELTTENFLRAIQIHFLECFLTFEEEFYLGYPLYQKCISNESNTVRNSYIPEYIRLDYGDNNNEVLKLIYETLKKGYIEPMTFEEFEAYFDSGSPRKKIRWLKNDVLLLLLFQGRDIDVPREGFKQLMIKTSNRPIKIICDNFLKKNGREFVSKHLDRSRKNLLSERNHGADEIISLLINIYKDFDKKK